MIWGDRLLYDTITGLCQRGLCERGHSHLTYWLTAKGRSVLVDMLSSHEKAEEQTEEQSAA